MVRSVEVLFSAGVVAMGTLKVITLHPQGLRDL
jgi:hypothetical protein